MKVGFRGCDAWGPEFDPWDLHSRSREHSSLTFTVVLWCAHTQQTHNKPNTWYFEACVCCHEGSGVMRGQWESEMKIIDVFSLNYALF